MADQSSPIAIASDGIFTQVTAGLESGYGLRNDGRIFSWGDNTYGQLGDGTTTGKSTPGLVQGVHEFNYIAAGWYHILGIKTNGELYSWGRGTTGQLGTGTAPITESSPVSVLGGHEFTKIDAGECHSIGLKADGTIWTWGCDDSGQLGGYQPIVGGIGAGAQGFGGAIDINTGYLWMWGLNLSGQLGTNNTTNYSSPRTVVGPQGWGFYEPIRELGTRPCDIPGNCGGIGQFSDNLSWAMKTDGSTWMWGDQNYGQLGVGGGYTTNYSSPRSVLGSGNNKFWSVYSTGGSPASTYYLAADGSLWVAGYTGYIGAGTTAPASINSPVDIESYIFDVRPSDPFVGNVWKWLSAAVFGGFVGTGSRVFAWGSNSNCKLCLGNCTSTGSPQSISGIWVHGCHGEDNSMLIDPSGNVWGCGEISGGRAGLGPGVTRKSTPAPVVGAPHSAIKVACGQNSQYFGFLRADGSLWMWGENNDGELGVGDTVSRTAPTSVLGSGVSYSFVDFVLGGESGTIAIDTEGQVWGWGQWGHVGDNTTSNRNVPTRTSLGQITPITFASSPRQVTTDTLFADIAAGDNHNLAIDENDFVWAWGDNAGGQLGLGDTINRSTPTMVSLPTATSWIDIAAGTQYSMAMRSNQDIWAWGDNTCGKLGDGTTTDKSSPVGVPAGCDPYQDDFGNSLPLHSCWNWEQGPIIAYPGSYDIQNHKLEITSGDAEMWGKNPFDPTWIYQTVPEDFDIKTYFLAPDTGQGVGTKQRIYLCATANTSYPPNNDYIWVGWYDSQPAVVNCVLGIANLTTAGLTPDYGSEVVEVRMQRRGSVFRTWYKIGGFGGWNELIGSPQLSIAAGTPVRLGIGAVHWAFGGGVQYVSPFWYFCNEDVSCT